MRKRVNGMAVLGALLLIVIVLSVAATVGVRAVHTIAISAGVFEAAASGQVFDGLEAQARVLLAQDAVKDTVGATRAGWANTELKLDSATGRGTAHVRDAQAAFNLNAMAFAPSTVIAGDAAANNPSAADANAARDVDARSADAGNGTDVDARGATAVDDNGSAARAAAGQAAPSADAAATAGGAGRGHDDAAMTALATVPGVVAASLARMPVAAPGHALILTPQQIAVARFALLLRALAIDGSVLPAVLDWLDSDSEPRFPNGAEDDYYAGLTPAYRAANRAFVDASELRLVRGVTAEVYAKLQPLVTVLPAQTPINVNTAPVTVLMSIAPGIDRTTAEMIVHLRTIRPFRSVAEFQQQPPLIGRPLVTQGLAVASEYFALDMQVASGRTEVSARATLVRHGANAVDVIDLDQGYFDD